MDRVYCNIENVCAITWSFTNKCNFACSYCPDHLHNGTVGFPDYDYALQFVTEVAKHHDHVHIELLGGEPTLWPKLILFLTELKQYPNIVIELSTNGGRTTNWWKKYCKADLHLNTLLGLSYHAAWCDPDLFYNNLAVLSEKHNVVANFMVDPAHFSKTYDLFMKVRDTLAVDCLFKVLRDQFHPSKLIDGYTDEMLDVIKNVPERNLYDRRQYIKSADKIQWPTKIIVNGERRNFQQMVIAGEHTFKGWKCGAGSKRFYIDFAGDVWPCTTIPHQVENKEIYRLGNINNKDIKILTDYIVCPVQYCPCKLDAVIDKFKED